ncbi:unnamed protein product [Chironomus riparius]|uniref:Phosphoglucomutase n=1 Tax=Chironomus riparius TaxID=315576 RepID=A0A9N9RIL1_9DIPT|nr:unnamed protein product [Chironomus riparius]
MAAAVDTLQINSGNTVLDEKIKEWLQWDKNEKTLNEIKSLVESKDYETLSKRLLNRMAFGTAGLRGPMRAGFDSMNDLVIVQTGQGLVKYVKECFPTDEDQQRGIVLSYDGRYNSRKFAELTATIFINENIPVYLYRNVTATPFVPFCVLEKKALCGIMVTASHNPKEDNGYKVYWENSAQIIPPHDKNIQNSILDNLVPFKSSWNLEALNSPLLHDPYDEMFASYFKKMLAVIPPKYLSINEEAQLKIVYTAMHGVGYPFVEHAYEVSKLNPVYAVIEQRDPDPEFPTVKFPNPEEGKSCLVLSMKLADEVGSDLIVANDPDADRLAIAERDPRTKQWKVFNGNEIGTLLGWWSIQYFKETYPEKSLSDCYLLASTVSSKMLGSMGKIDGYNFEETLTGFKWMGNRSVDLMEQGKTVLFAYEEAIGFMFSPTVLDKDGVSASAHLATLASHLKVKEGLSLCEKLDQLYETYGYHYSINSYFLCYEPEKIVKIFERIRNWNGIKDEYPLAVLDGKYKIAGIRDLTTGIDTSQADRKSLLPSSKSSQMITFTLENDTVVTLRTSGTEPKIKYYSEYCAKPDETDWKQVQANLKEIVEALVDEFLQPNENELIARAD